MAEKDIEGLEETICGMDTNSLRSLTLNYEDSDIVGQPNINREMFWSIGYRQQSLRQLRLQLAKSAQKQKHLSQVLL